MTYDQLANADPDRTAKAAMALLNSLSGRAPAEKLLAVSAVYGAMCRAAQKQLGITRTDLETILANMRKKVKQKITIAEQAIERTMTE